jgi:hypothetical protein
MGRIVKCPLEIRSGPRAPPIAPGAAFAHNVAMGQTALWFDEGVGMADASASAREPIRTALFVDFDNIYIGLEKRSRVAADRFATEPWRWLRWFEAGSHDPPAMGQPRRRRVLVRRCYLNPREFSAFRGDFTRAAFTVVDCPPLTARGKTSSDIYMVMDMLEALEHRTVFEEFVILSADADFTPVLLRLRAHDRRTTILCSELAAAAYRAACDLVVEQDTFIAEALEIAEADEGPARADSAPDASYEPVIRRAAALVKETVAREGVIDARDLPRLFGAFPEFRNSSWFGRFSLNELADTIAQMEPWLAFAGDRRGDWSFVAGSGAGVDPADSPRPDVPPAPDEAALEREIVGHVVAVLAGAERPMPMAQAASLVVQRLGRAATASGWAGRGAFKALLAAQRRDDIALLAVAPGFVYDPRRHDPSQVAVPEDLLTDVRPDLAAFIRRVSSATGVPGLSPADYRALHETVVEALHAGNTHAADLSRVARDLCQARGRRIPRSAVNFMLSSFRYHDFDPADRSPAELAAEWRHNVAELADSAQLALSAAEQAMLDEWLLPQAAEPEAAAPAVPVDPIEA